MNKLDHILNYARKGLSVIPMSGKRPMVKFADTPPMTESEIINFWGQYPDANVAIRTTSFFVVDVDVHDNANGVQSFKSIGHDEWFKNTLCQRTASGGYHYFFMKPKDVEVKQVIGLLDGIDIKAHINNYVLVAPSSINGQPYQFLNNKPIVEAPQGLLQFIKEKSAKDYAMSDFQGVAGERNRTTELFETLANGLGFAGGRNATLASFCGGLLFRGVCPNDVLKLANIANGNTESPLPMNEVTRTVESMIKKDIRRRELE